MSSSSSSQSNLADSGLADARNLEQLGSKTEYKYDQPHAGILETFPNPADPDNVYAVDLQFNEFTSLCPKTGQPDFAELKVTYWPREKCVETKSFKLYLFAYRNQGAFMERITNQIRDDLVKVLEPNKLLLTMQFNARGGIALTCAAQYDRYAEEAAKAMKEARTQMDDFFATFAKRPTKNAAAKDDCEKEAVKSE